MCDPGGKSQSRGDLAVLANAVPFHTRCSALLIASKNNNVEAIDTLVEAGADVGALHAKHTTALHCAVEHGSYDALVALLRHGCDKEKADIRGRTPLHLAVQGGFSATMIALLNTGANVAARYGVPNRSALDMTVYMGRLSEAEVLIQYGADVNATTQGGVTALHKAAILRRVDSIVALIGLGASVDARNNNGVTPLMEAAGDGEDGRFRDEGEDGREACAAVLALLKSGANAKARGVQMRSPLHYATFSSWPDDFFTKVKLLLESGAEETAVDADGLTAIWLAEKVAYDDENAPWSERGNPMEHHTSWDCNVDRVQDLFEQAPAERRNRAWRRRCLLVLWRAQPHRFDPVQALRKAPAGRMEPIILRSGKVKGRDETHVLGGRDGTVGVAVGMLAARVAGLEEEGIFRRVVMYL